MGLVRSGRLPRTPTNPPYPAGIVLHPVIEACVKLHDDLGLRSKDVVEVELTGHPLLRQRTDRPDVTTGRLSQVCAQHAIAIALRRGKARIPEFADDAVSETLRDGIRPNVMFIDDESRAIEFVHMRVQTRQGQTHDIEVSAAKGGPTNPMTDGDIEDKLAEPAGYRGFTGDVRAIADAVYRLSDFDRGAPNLVAGMIA